MKDEMPPHCSFHSSSCPPPNSPLPTYQERNAHRDQQAQFVTEVSHQQLALHENTWEVWIPIWSANSPMQNICQPSFTSKGIPTWVEGYFLKWNCFQLYIKLIQPFNTPPMFSYLPHTYSVSNASCVRQNEQRKVHSIIRNWSALLFMHKVYMSVWFWHRHLDHIEKSCITFAGIQHSTRMKTLSAHTPWDRRPP